MKKFIYLMAMVCTLGFFTACSSDDDNNENDFNRNEKIEGTWKVQDAGFDASGNSTGSVVLNWKGSDDAVITIPGLLDEPYPVKDAIKMAPMLLNSQLRSVLQDVTFNEKGQISATYKEDDKDWKVASDYATYQVVNENMITLFLNTAKIIADIDDAQEQAMVAGMLDQFKTGIPVHVSYPAANKVYFYVDKDFVAPIIAMLNAQVDKIPFTGMDKEDLAQFLILKTVVKQLPTIMEKTTKFEAGLELIK
jgi:major membrane immunogen (membrane-anchored lipoprotein)